MSEASSSVSSSASITVYQLPEFWGLPSISPFCLKLSTWLHMRGLPFEATMGDMRKSPTGKLPYVKYGDEMLTDSQLIIERLIEDHGNELDAHLSETDMARGHLMRRTLEESFYHVLVASRWDDDEGFRQLRPVFDKMLPAPLRAIIPGVVRRSVRKQLLAQGVLRHERATYLAMGVADLEAISRSLGDQPFLLGDRATTIDATGYGMIASAYYGEPNTPLKQFIATSNLAPYCDRLRDQLWSDA